MAGNSSGTCRSAALDKTPPGAEERSRSEGPALGAAQGSQALAARPTRRSGRPDRPGQHKRTARAWLYREQLREILERKQINVVSTMLRQWRTNVMRSKVEPMKQVARMIRSHFEGIVAWTQTRQTNGFLEALNGLCQAAKRKARGYTRFQTMRTVLFLIAGKLDFSRLDPHAS
jgi:hypothetical protein